MSAPGPGQRPALRRRTEHRLVAGVAGGLADWLNAPVIFVRIVLLFATLYEPVLWAYAAAALLMPPRGRNLPGWDNVLALGRLGVLLLVPALALSEHLSLNESFQEPLIWVPLYGLMLAGLAALLTADYLRGHPRTEAEARTAFVAALPAGVTAGVLALAVVLLPDTRWDHVLPVPALAGGLALLVAARHGRSRPFVAPAVVALALAAVLVAEDARLDGGVGDIRLAPTSTDGSLVVRRAMGDVTVDLRRTASPGPLELRASTGRGAVHVAVPSGAAVRIDARVGQGAVESTPLDAGWTRREGYDIRVADSWRPRRGARQSGSLVHVIAEVGSGSIKVRRGRDALAQTGP